MAHDEFIQHEADENSASFPNISSSKNFIDNSIKNDLGLASTYWEALYRNYEIKDKKELMKFIFDKGEKFKKFLLFVPKMNDLRKNRNKADYNNEFKNLDDYAQYSIIRSGEILNILNSFK